MPAAQTPENGPVGIPGVDDMTLGEVQGSVVQGSGFRVKTVLPNSWVSNL